ncbi:beta-lactamase family protein [Flavobacteriales bacterium]|nr:beta-lactamase family protein [Flavobacteriales bacterium]
MKSTLRAIAAFVLAAVLLSYLTNYDYLWGGIRETWLRGWENAQIDDLPFRDHVRTIPASSNPQPWPEGPNWDQVAPDEDGRTWLENSKTASFLVIQNDSVVYESYFKGHDVTTLTNSFSMVKSITAMAVGLAVNRGLVDEQARLSEYLPRFAEGENADLTVQEVLQMRSNIPFGESYKDPFGFQAKAYYRDDNRTLLEPYRVEGTPGTTFHYQGGNTMLLAEVLDQVRDGNLSNDIANGLWEQMGAEHDAFWGLDGDPSEGAVERSFAQYYATTRDFARFGQLLLDTGAWKGQQLLPRDFTERMITPIERLTDEVDTDFYGYQIWLGTTDDGLPFSMLEGLRGQMVISLPDLDMVVVRTGYDKLKAKKRDLPVDTYTVIDVARRLQ